jgi:hypothetical protein
LHPASHGGAQTAVIEAMSEAHKESLMVMGKKMAELYQGMGLPIGNPGA